MRTSVRFSYDQYEEMIRMGLFDPPEEHRVELLFGKIVPVYGKSRMSPINPRHDYAVDRLNEWSFEVVPRGAVWVRVQGSFGVPGLNSIPQPDLAWLAREEYVGRRPTPRDVLLVVEVSDSTLSKGRGSKSRLYAAAGIGDYWIVDVKRQTVEVRRNPLGSTFQSREVFSLGREIHPLAFPEISLPVSRLFPE